MKAEIYFNNIKASFLHASNVGNVNTRIIQVDDFIIKMNFIGNLLIPTFYDAFQHLAIPQTSKHASLTINFFDAATTAIEIEIPWKKSEMHHLGLVESFTDDRFHTLHQPGSNAIYMLDVSANEGYYWISKPSEIPSWESDFPLRMIFHWWLKYTSYQPVHAAAVGTENGGVLLVGKGGSGKSTSALSCVNSDLKIAGDDYVLLDCEKNIAHSLFSLTKLTTHSIQMLPNLKIDYTRLQESFDDKHRIKLYPNYKESLIRQIPIVALLLPRVTDNTTTEIERCNTAEAMLALAPTTLFQLPGLREIAFNKMSRFTRSVPAFHLRLGKDSTFLPELLKDFITSVTVASESKYV